MTTRHIRPWCIFQVVVMGTGFTECLLSGLLAIMGMKVRNVISLTSCWPKNKTP